jgi:hypothetical protein
MASARDGGEQTQLLAVQTRAPAHCLPHAPQLASSVWVSTHAPEHTDFCASSQAHLPLEQWELAGQAASHAPQCAAFVRVSTQVAALWQYV